MSAGDELARLVMIRPLAPGRCRCRRRWPWPAVRRADVDLCRHQRRVLPLRGQPDKNTCSNRVSVREDVARRCVLRAIQDDMSSPEGIAHYRKRVAEELRNYSRNLEARRKKRTERLVRTEDKIRGLIEFIATGDRSEYVVATLRDLEAFARAEKAALAGLAEQASRPLRLPSNDEVMALAIDLEGCLTDDPEVGRATLRR